MHAAKRHIHLDYALGLLPAAGVQLAEHWQRRHWQGQRGAGLQRLWELLAGLLHSVLH